MEWMNSNLKEIEPTNISNQEQKEKIAKEIAQKVKDGDVIGFGSGSTSYLAIKEIAKRIEEEELHITAIPTSYEIKALCHSLNIPTVSILEKRPDWAFDGADEVDKNNNWIIKGRGEGECFLLNRQLEIKFHENCLPWLCSLSAEQIKQISSLILTCHTLEELKNQMKVSSNT